eukprot:12969572-Heterocapsa_arctica.AAC.1
MKAAERHPVIIDQTTMASTLKQKSRLLYGILVQILGGRALTILKTSPSGNGFETWRQLVAEYQPVTPL